MCLSNVRFKQIVIRGSLPQNISTRLRLHILCKKICKFWSVHLAILWIVSTINLQAGEELSYAVLKMQANKFYYRSIPDSPVIKFVGDTLSTTSDLALPDTYIHMYTYSQVYNWNSYSVQLKMSIKLDSIHAGTYVLI